MPNFYVGPPLEHNVLNRFQSLLYVPSPSSREGQLADVICWQVRELGFAPEVDPGGNVLVKVAGREPDLPTWCYAAHMDEIGMTVTRLRADGNLEVAPSGGLYPWKIGERPVEVLGDADSIVGVLSMGSTHTPEAADKKVTWADVWITTGLSLPELSAAGIRPGSLAVPHAAQRGPVVFGSEDDPMAASWTFDDRLGCALQMELLARLQADDAAPRRPSVFAFTCHEEGGGHGAKNVARAVAPEAFIAIDGAPAPPDTPLRVDHRPATWSQDALAHYDHGLLRAIIDAGQEAGVEVQTVVYARAASDASLAYAAGLAPRALAFGCVRGNSHGYEVLKVRALSNALDTLYRFVTTR